MSPFPRDPRAPNVLTEGDVRALLSHSPLLDAEDYAELAATANADPEEGADWLPHYKIALGLLAHAFGLVEAVAGLNTPPNSPADRRRMAVVRRARELFKLSNIVAAVGPTGSPEALANARAVNAELDELCPLPKGGA